MAALNDLLSILAPYITSKKRMHVDLHENKAFISNSIK